MSTSTDTSCNVAANVTFIDLATYSELEAFYYGGMEAITWFVASVQKSNWFSFVPIVLRQQGTFDFGQKNVSAHMNRSGDYVLSVFFRVQIPLIELYQSNATAIYANASIAWTRNLMHNIFEKVQVTHNELVVHEFDNFWMDFVYQFHLDASKRVGYRNMIGDIFAMTNPQNLNNSLGTGGFFTAPLPLWFTLDSGVALPVAALPFNDVRVNYCFRRVQELIVLYPGDVGAAGARVATFADIRVVGTANTVPAMVQPETYAHYVVVHNDERVKMGDAPRDMPIRQTQMVSATPVNPSLANQAFDLRLSHSIIAFFFVYRNKAIPSEWSNYTTDPNYVGADPISYSRLRYENTDRLAMASDYYSLTCPYYFSNAIPEQTGYHMWSYALLPWEVAKPSGSTNYSKLANVSIVHSLSAAAANASNAAAPVDSQGNPILYPDAAGNLVAFPQSWDHIFQAANWNVVRVANGSLGQPVL
jgi:hypothetical protein